MAGRSGGKRGHLILDNALGPVASRLGAVRGRVSVHLVSAVVAVLNDEKRGSQRRPILWKFRLLYPPVIQLGNVVGMALDAPTCGTCISPKR